jgi:hypothetical protein
MDWTDYHNSVGQVVQMLEIVQGPVPIHFCAKGMVEVEGWRQMAWLEIYACLFQVGHSEDTLLALISFTRYLFK